MIKMSYKEIIAAWEWYCLLLLDEDKTELPIKKE